MCIRDRNKVTNDNNDIENDNIIKNVISESDTLEIDNEIVSESERMIGCNGVVISVVAVSYTHLDVYKRQGY